MTVPLKVSSVIVISWLIQESLCLKPDWLEEIRHLSKEHFFCMSNQAAKGQMLKIV